jgi:hypothetical protein
MGRLAALPLYYIYIYIYIIPPLPFPACCLLLRLVITWLGVGCKGGSLGCLTR